METAGSSEKRVHMCQTKRRRIVEDRNVKNDGNSRVWFGPRTTDDTHLRHVTFPI